MCESWPGIILSTEKKNLKNINSTNNKNNKLKGKQIESPLSIVKIKHLNTSNDWLTYYTANNSQAEKSRTTNQIQKLVRQPFIIFTYHKIL